MIKVFHRLIFRTKYPHLFLIFCAVIAIIAVSFFILTRVINQKSFEPSTFLKEIRTTATNKDTFFGSIRDRLREIVAAGGTSGAVKLTQEAFVQGDITFVHCHILMHLAGHITEAQQTKKVENAIHNPDLCGDGYSHGLEAQIVRENAPDVFKQIYNLCTAIQRVSPGKTCYEGVGHAFMEETLNVEKALGMCDVLSSDGPLRDPFMCYKGVFAQYTNLIGGDDTETGMKYTGGPQMVLPARTPIAYCASLPEKYKLMCAHEVCGFRAVADIALALTEAVEENYPIEMKAACVHNAAGSKAERELGYGATIMVPPIVFSLSKELRRQYIAGTMGEFNGYARNGAHRDWQSFCNAFPEESDRAFCANLIQKNRR